MAGIIGAVLQLIASIAWTLTMLTFRILAAIFGGLFAGFVQWLQSRRRNRPPPAPGQSGRIPIPGRDDVIL